MRLLETFKCFWHFLLHPSALWRQVSLWWQYFFFYQHYVWLKRGELPREERGEVLIVNFTDWVPRAKLDGILAAAFRLRGYEPIVLTSRSCSWSVRYLRSCGVRRLLFLEDFLTEASLSVDEEEVWKIVGLRPSFHDLYTFEWKGVGVGRHVLSTVIRELKQGSSSFTDASVQSLLRKFLPRSLRTAAAALLLFDRIHPVTVLFLEKGYTPYGEIFDVALLRGLSPIQYFHGHRSDLLVMRRFNFENRFQHPFSLSMKSWEKIKNMAGLEEHEKHFMEELRRGYEEGSWMNRKFLLQGKSIKTIEEVRSQLRLDPTKKTAVIFSHVLWDATFFFGENLFLDYEQWLVATVKAACENRGVNWVVKLHPDYVWKVKQMGESASPRDVLALEANIGELPSHIQIVPPDTDISTYSFFPITDYCITVRGTIGIEAPCFGIRTFTAGTGRYSGLGFTEDSATAEEYLKKMRHIQDFPPLSNEERTLARKHAYALFHLRPLPFTSCEIAPKSGGSFDQEAVIRLHSLKDLEQAEDLQHFTSWVLDSKEEDYLLVPEARQLTPA